MYNVFSGELMRRLISIILILCTSLWCTACFKTSTIVYTYGVFLGAGPEDMEDMLPYETIVIDAQYFSPEDIRSLKEQGHRVFSYINLGSVEEFRPYYSSFSDLFLGVYENWEDERWVDVSSPRWQDFMVSLADSLLDKGVDGLFVDNTDVYYNYPMEEIYQGITDILLAFRSTGTYVSINGGDFYVTEYYSREGEITSIMNGENQETVFSAINWEDDEFTSNSPEEFEFFSSYVEFCKENGIDVYLLEYTTDEELMGQIDSYCSEKGFYYYCSPSLDLKEPASSSGSQSTRRPL